MKKGFNADIFICSPAIFKGEKRNNVGELIHKRLAIQSVTVNSMKLTKGSPREIKDLLDQSTADFMIFSGGTSAKSKYVSINVLSPLLDFRFSEMEEMIQQHGEKQSKLAKRSVPLIGKKGKSIVMAIPGSTNGARDALEIIFPSVFELC